MVETLLNFLRTSWLKMALSYGLMGLLFGFAVWTAYDFLDRLQSPRWVSQNNLPFVPPAPPSKSLVQILQTTSIFMIENFSSLPDAVGLMVTGIFLNTKKGDSHVLVGVTGQASQSYAVGDTLPSGQRLYKIFPDKVILIQDGELSKSSFGFPGIDFPTQLPNGLFTR